ncbi:inositol monophosphatase family protein [Micromonospora sp. NPDC002389]|uniref:inositol monophosphatase family protein n=1 Tax=Micromonospora sp. NPDC002389 TaxID=3154272 RepID=UPI00331964C0
MTSYRDFLPIAVEAARRAADAMRQQTPVVLTTKGDRDVASELDYAIERDLRAFLDSATPGIGFLGEEEGLSGSPSKRWVLDPIDGTSNYVRGLPLCAVSLALVQEMRPWSASSNTVHSLRGGGRYPGHDRGDRHLESRHPRLDVT